eukprot:806578-Prymnesium_polylepis.1
MSLVVPASHHERRFLRLGAANARSVRAVQGARGMGARRIMVHGEPGVDVVAIAVNLVEHDVNVANHRPRAGDLGRGATGHVILNVRESAAAANREVERANCLIW